MENPISEKKYPRIGVGVIILKEGKVLVGKRTYAHGASTWEFPGGKLEWRETIEECAKKEAFEETGVIITNVKRAPYTEDYWEKEDKHYITLYVVANWKSGEPRVTEPGKSEQWHWCEWEKLPKPLFKCIQTLVDSGFNPFKKNF